VFCDELRGRCFPQTDTVASFDDSASRYWSTKAVGFVESS
jgi:hypothetical protein